MKRSTRALRLAAAVAASAAIVALAGSGAGARPQQESSAAQARHAAVAATTAPAALRYAYSFAGAKAAVRNTAPGGPVVPLTLRGAWSAVTGGVHFKGGTNGVYSVAEGTPASGDTISAPASDAVGVALRMRYAAPADGCFGDTPNIAQIGRFIAHHAQVKVQLSKCADSKTSVVFQCRFAGTLTPASVDPVSSTLHLVNGGTYDVTCLKSADRSTGRATVTFTVTRVKATGNRTVTSTYKVAATGALVTQQAVSVGNKYPVPPSADNTDQFNGDVDAVRFCVGTLAATKACLVG